MPLTKVLTVFQKVVHGISRRLNILGLCFVGFMMLLTVADVLLRWIFNRPITGVFEITEYLLVVIMAFTVPWCTIQDKQMKVDLVVSRFKRHIQVIIDTLTCMLSLAICIIITWHTFTEAIYIYESGRASALLEVPAYPVYFLLSFGFGVLSLTAASRLIDFFKEVRKR